MSKAIEKEIATLAIKLAFIKYTEELAHFYSGIDFGKSHLDARAITFMNVGLGVLTESIARIIGEM